MQETFKGNEFDLWVKKIPWRRKWQSTPVFLPGKFHGKRSLVGYSSWGCKETDKAEHACTQMSNVLWKESLNWDKDTEGSWGVGGGELAL